jgi:HPt (histidine-containing phosphotransfer) domain-containing protein
MADREREQALRDLKNGYNSRWRRRSMTVQECYDMMQGDYEGVSERLLKDERIEKFLRKFLADKDYEELMSSLAEKDYETAFRASHSLKGLSLNLGLTGLQKASETLCEELRGGEPSVDITPMRDAVEEEYQKVILAIGML